MKILWVGDAVVSSGFARCTHAACDALHAAGHKVAVLGINYHGDPHKYPYPIFPCYQPLDGGRDGFGVTRLPHLVARTEPDVVVLLNDPWNIEPYLDALAEVEHKPLVLAWLAVDGENQHAKPLNRLDGVAVWTAFARDELLKGGLEAHDPRIIPLGVDSEVFKARDKAESRAAIFPNLDPNAFLVGVVGRNQPRKRIDLTLAYFAEWIRTHDAPEAMLYLHVAPTGDVGVDIRSLVRYYGLAGRVLASNVGIGEGARQSDLVSMYSALDVYWTTTQGEGWGLPTLEAMACGVPCIVPDFSGLGSWVGDAALKVICRERAMTAPQNWQLHTIGGVPDRTRSVLALESMRKMPPLREEYARRGRALAESLSWSATAAGVVEWIESATKRSGERGPLRLVEGGAQ